MTIESARETPLEYVLYKIGIIKRSLLLTLIVSCISLFFSRKFTLGFFVGGVISMANFSLLAKYVLTMRGYSISRAKRYIISKFLILYAIMAAALFIAAAKGMAVFAGAALGLLVIKGVLFFEARGVNHGKPV